MAVAPTSTTSSLTTAKSSATNPKSVLGKDDFMKLLLVELKYQDPTKPTDTGKILTQTSQLASLESANNTNTALTKLSKSLSSSQQFSTIAAIGKTASLGNDAINYNKGSNSTFEMYFPKAVKAGSIEIKDNSGHLVKTLNVGKSPSGVYKFTWNGTDNGGVSANSGIYHVSATYQDSNNVKQSTTLGTYPIESVKFDKGQTFVKLGSNYVPLGNVKEVY